MNQPYFITATIHLVRGAVTDVYVEEVDLAVYDRLGILSACFICLTILL